jgi:hypothetical protein
MTGDHPTILEQIDAVEAAEVFAPQFGWRPRLGKRPKLTDHQIRQLCRRLEAAAETLRTLHFGSEIAR